MVSETGQQNTGRSDTKRGGKTLAECVLSFIALCKQKHVSIMYLPFMMMHVGDKVHAYFMATWVRLDECLKDSWVLGEN